MSWVSLKKLLLKQFCDATFKHTEHTVMNISSKVIFEVSHAVEASKNVCFRVDWIDREIGEIHKEQEIMSLYKVPNH